MAQFHGRGVQINKSFKKFFPLTLANCRGQIAIESVLLIAILMAGFMAFKNTLQARQPVQKLMDHGAKRVKHMTEYGVWREQCRPVTGGSSETAANCHPNSINRSLSSLPD